VDNIDHNPSSTTAHDSFHGTGISLFQPISTEHPGVDRGAVVLQCFPSSGKGIKPLPESYTHVRRAFLHNQDPPVPEVQCEVKGDGSTVQHAIEEEFHWFDNVNNTIKSTETLTGDESFSWAAYHSKLQEVDSPVAISSLLPLFPDNSKSVAMIRHSMDVVKLAVDSLNPRPVPVIAMDQPLFAVAKQIQ
jgi:hypothetical protein